MAENPFLGRGAEPGVDHHAAMAAKIRAMTAEIAGAEPRPAAPPKPNSPLQSAAGLGLLKPLEAAIAAGDDLNAVDSLGLTPLMAACSLGKVKGGKAALRLMEAGADVRYVRASDGITALKFAVHACDPEILRELIARGADVDGPPGTDQTALMIAARANNVKALEVLIEAGADPTIPCGIKWAAGRTAEGLAEMEKCRAAASYLKRVRTGA